MNDDPFAKARAIRKGTLDHELPDFEEMTGWFQRVPMTWLPALLIACVEQCVVQNVFQDGGLLTTVKYAEKKASEPAPFLREGNP